MKAKLSIGAAVLLARLVLNTPISTAHQGAATAERRQADVEEILMLILVSCGLILEALCAATICIIPTEVVAVSVWLCSSCCPPIIGLLWGLPVGSYLGMITQFIGGMIAGIIDGAICFSGM